jgi:hypothetical protein
VDAAEAHHSGQAAYRDRLLDLLDLLDLGDLGDLGDLDKRGKYARRQCVELCSRRRP